VPETTILLSVLSVRAGESLVAGAEVGGELAAGPERAVQGAVGGIVSRQSEILVDRSRAGEDGADRDDLAGRLNAEAEDAVLRVTKSVVTTPPVPNVLSSVPVAV
jgi:hypothetical protein